MWELELEDQAAADRLSAFLLGEVYRSVAKVLAQSDPAVADALFRRVETTIAATLQRIGAERAEGPNSTAIALTVCRDVGAVLKSAHALPERTASVPAPAPAERPASRWPARAA